MASLICAQLLFLESENPNKDISFYINSPGGVVTRAWRSTTRCSTSGPPVSTVCIGQAASMGSLLLAAGAKGKRFCAAELRGSWSTSPRAAPRARRPTSRSRRARSWRCAARLNEIYVKHTGQPLEAIEDALERDKFMTAEEAKDFGLIDEVVENRPTARGRRAESQA